MNLNKSAGLVGFLAIAIILGQWFLVSGIDVVEQSDSDVAGIQASPAPESSPELNELTNDTYGYSFKYPSDWQAISVQEKVEVTSQIHKGKIVIDATSDPISFIIENESELNDEQKLATRQTLATIQSNFQSTQKTEVTQEEINQRYKETLKGDN